MNSWKPYKNIRKDEYGVAKMFAILLIFVEL